MSEARELRAFLERRTGFAIPADRWEFLAPRFLARLAGRGFESVAAYVRHLEHDPHGPAELEELFCALTVRKTGFFRNRAVFEALSGLIPELCRARSPDRPVAMWSAGCASGEETWSLAMVAKSALPPSGPGAYILGTDIVQEALARAREGAYPATSLEDVPEPHRRQGTLVGARMWIRQELREWTEFALHNLVTDQYPRPAGGMWDVIFCRNVLIYFGVAQAREVLQRFQEVMAPGGCLFLGHAEVFTDVEPEWEVVFKNETFFYRRRAPELRLLRPPGRTPDRPPQPTPAPGVFHEAPTERWTGLPSSRAGGQPGQTPTRAYPRGQVTPFAAIGPRRWPSPADADETVDETRADRRPEESLRPALLAAERLLAGGRAEEAVPALRALLQQAPAFTRARALLSRAHEQLGQLEQATREAELAQEHAPLDPWTHTRVGRLRLLQGSPTRAEQALRRALYLEPDLLPARWSLAEALRAANRPDRAARELRNVLRSLRTLPAERLAQLAGEEDPQALRRRCEQVLAELGAAEDGL